MLHIILQQLSHQQFITINEYGREEMKLNSGSFSPVLPTICNCYEIIIIGRKIKAKVAFIPTA